MNNRNTFNKIINSEFLYVFLSFLMPLIFYWGVFLGKSFGFDCSPGVMGNYPPYGQTVTAPNLYCASIIDPAAYTLQFPPMLASIARQFFQGNFAIWSQNIGNGIPLAANFQSNAFNPILLPFTLLFNASHYNLFYLDIFFVFRYMIMSLGMYLFLRSFKLDRIICYIGSLAFFSSGYFIYIPAIAHHNVDILLPLLAWSINNLYFKKETKWIGISILILGVSMLGGMPESSIFILFFTSLYVTFLSLFFIERRKVLYLFLGWLIVIGGLGIGAMLYFPGVEYILNGLSVHHAGQSQKFLNPREIVLFFLPKLFGGTSFYWSAFADKIDFNPQGWNYIGSIIFFLYISSTFYLKTIIDAIKKNRVMLIFFFFFILTAVLLLQLYGIIHFFIFENLPGFKETQFTKYSSSLINFSIISSVCLFIPYMLKKITKKLFLVYILFVILLYFYNVHYHAIITGDYFINKYFGLASNIFFALFFLTSIIFSLYLSRNKKITLFVILAMLLIEYYMYFPRFGDKTRKDSFRQPPSISFLKKDDYHSFRIFGLDNILYPNLSTTYDLNDMRILDALWIGRHYAYIENFYAEPYFFRIASLRDGTATKSADIVNNPYFDLLSVKYILSYNQLEKELNSGDETINKILTENKPTQFLNQTMFTINKDTRYVLFEHAPGDIKATLIKPGGASYFYLYPAMNQDLFDTGKNSGVRFVAKIYKNGVIYDEQEISIDPAHKKEDQKWNEIKLGPFPKYEENTSYQLELITEPIGISNAYDWTGWAGFEWDNQKNVIFDKYRLVYDQEMKIYENKDFIPRLRFINKTLCIDPNKAKKDGYSYVINLLKQYRSDIKQLAIVESNDCKDATYSPDQVQITSKEFNDQNISFTYTSTQSQYGILSDAYYPGWNIYINGKKRIIDPVNLAFRGFNLPQGENIKVEMKYEPLSFKIGLLISLVTLVVTFCIIYKNKLLHD